MSWQGVGVEIQQVALDELTPKQLAVWKLHLAGLGARRISDMLEITRSTVRTHLADAHRRLETAGVRCDASGRYYRKDRTAA